jgi:putative N6-adenine-specific DNA methylase
MHWKDFDHGLWETVKAASDEKIVPLTVPLYGADRAHKAIVSARENIRFAGLPEGIQLKEVSFEESTPPVEKGFIVCNPPYDERIRLDDAIAFYKMIGNTLKRNYSGYTAWFISSDLASLKFIGLRPSRKITVYNGPLECRFVQFALYPGKKGD